MIIDLAEPGKRTVLFSTHITSDLEAWPTAPDRARRN